MSLYLCSLLSHPCLFTSIKLILAHSNKFLTLTDTGSFSRITTQKLGTCLGTELHCWKALLKGSTLSCFYSLALPWCSPKVCVALQRLAVYTGNFCVTPMDLHVQICHFVCDKLHLSHSIYLGSNYPWNGHKILCLSGRRLQYSWCSWG